MSGTNRDPGFRLRAWPWALLYLAFVVYGSLVPLDFHPLPMGEAWERFRRIPFLDLGIASRADWVANLLLFVPLAFLALGSLWHRWRSELRLAASLLVLVLAPALAAAIEFTQLFFPPRTVSQNDIIAESLGALIGVILWWVAGKAIVEWVAGWRSNARQAGLANRLLVAYLALLFGYGLLPLDLSLSPVDLYHKWKEGRVVLFPLGQWAENPVQAAYGVITDVAIWFPAGFLARLASDRPAPRLLWLGLAAAAALEMAQLLVYSRVTDASDVLTAGLGLYLGIRCANPCIRLFGTAANQPWRNALLVGWLAVLFAVFWYPFDFRFDLGFVMERLQGSGRVPFEAYYFGSEYRAVTEVLHKTGFFLVLGGLLALRRGPGAAAPGWALAAVALVGAGVEAAQLLLPAKNADITDWLLESVGGAAGVWLAGVLRHAPGAPEPAAPVAADPPGRAGLRGPVLEALLGLAGLAAVLWLASRSGVVPYNVRELFAEGSAAGASFLLAGAAYWCVGAPFALAIWIGAGRPLAGVLWLPGILLVSCVAWLWVWTAVPIEAVHDLVGTPVMGWPAGMEVAGRFVVLYAGLAFALGFAAGAYAVAARAGSVSGAAWAGACGLLFLPFWHWVVVRQAATDNLTELMAGGGSALSTAWLALAGLALCLAGTGLAASSVRRFPRRALALGVAAVCLLLGALGLVQGLESAVVKYGKVFSALQFLLSPDREHLVAGPALWLRLGFALCAWTLMVALVQRPFWRWVEGSARGLARPSRRRPALPRQDEGSERPGLAAPRSEGSGIA